MDYKEIRRVIGDGEVVIVFDGDYLDWGNAKILPEGILLTGKTGLSIEGERECFYPFEDLMFVAQEGFIFERIAEGEVSKRKVIILRMGIALALGEETAIFQGVLGDPGKRDGRLVWGDPILIEKVGLFLFPNSLHLVQEGGAQALLSLDVDCYVEPSFLSNQNPQKSILS